MTKEEAVEQMIRDVINDDYSHTTFTSVLWDMFAKDKQSIEAYIKPNREFWHFDGSKGFRKLKVTYVRSGVMFFVFEDEPDIEKAWFIGSFNSDSLHAAQIYPYEIGRLLSKQFKNSEKDFPKICKQCKWDDCNGRIKVDVIWDK